ncbi:MAG: hypothetical protein H7328_07060 [Bdellovibrio sp.]|nr:hypothetical protein [Bdellovibrio sp.]
MITMTSTFIAVLFSISAYATTHTTRNVECTNGDTTALNRFTIQGSLDITGKSVATGEISLTTQMAGRDTLVSETIVLSSTGTFRTYAARSLGSQEVTLVQLKAQAQGRLYNLTIASGLSGAQSTLIVQGIPFRAECKLK